MDGNSAPAAPAMPRSRTFDPARPDATRPEPSAASGVALAAMATSDRNNVFGHLVHDDGDIAGLVAYSIYKQHKLDWLRAFETAKGRAPDENELASYIIGEGTARRLATYRHLAEATLAGNGPEVEGAPAPAMRLAPARRRSVGGLLGEGYATGTVALYALIAVLFVIGFYLALHFTGTTR